MKQFSGLLLAATLVLTGCASGPMPYETADLMLLTHNQHTDFTLIVYKDSFGRTSQVLRRKGVCEFVLSEDEFGVMTLKERGKEVREIEKDTFDALQVFIDTVIYLEEEMPQSAETSST